MKNGENKGIYLFCFAHSRSVSDLEGTAFSEENPLLILVFRDIAAVLCEISLEEFTGQGAEARMQDLAWIGPKALEHESVIEQVMQFSPVFPARFGTIFLSFERVKELIANHHELISRFLDRMIDKDELAVKAFLDRTKAKEEIASGMIASQEGALSHSPGMRYIQEKRIRLAAERELSNRLSEICADVWKHLRRCAAEYVERKVLPTGSAEAEGEMVFNWAFLVPKSELVEFRSIVERANKDYTSRGLVFQCSGPWPPYSFIPALAMEQ